MRIWLILILVLFSCSCSPANSSKGPDTKGSDSFEFYGKVIFVQLEGGFFGLEDQSGTHYLPDRIPPVLRKDGQAVRVKAHPAPPAVGFRMWGRSIIIEEISAP